MMQVQVIACPRDFARLFLYQRQYRCQCPYRSRCQFQVLYLLAYSFLKINPNYYGKYETLGISGSRRKRGRSMPLSIQYRQLRMVSAKRNVHMRSLQELVGLGPSAYDLVAAVRRDCRLLSRDSALSRNQLHWHHRHYSTRVFPIWRVSNIGKCFLAV